jgi:hypothetical protein
MEEGSIESVYVDSRTLRQRFAALGILDQLQRGELRAEIDRSWRAPAERGQPAGTLGQRVQYFRGAELTAVVHQYLLPDGSIGGSGLPDPKWLRDGDRILKYRLE